MKIFRRASVFILSSAMIVSMGITVSAKELVTIDGHKYVSEGGENTLYTGWTTVNGLHRYYKDGKRCIGWHKIGDSYYYLTRYGGRARGLYQIGDTVYEFGEDGKYIGKAKPDEIVHNVYAAAVNDGVNRIKSYATMKTDQEGNPYSEDFGGISYNNIESVFELYLINNKNENIYKDLYGECTLSKLKITETNVSFNNLVKLNMYLSQNMEKLEIYSIMLSHNKVKIEMQDVEDEDIKQLHDHLTEQGFTEEMFYIDNVGYEYHDWWYDDYE